MKKTLFLVLIAISTFGQTKKVITGDDIVPIGFAIPGYYLFSGKHVRIITTTDLLVKPGSSGSIDLTDTTKIFFFIPDGGAKILNYTIPGGTPPIPGTDSVSVDNQPGAAGLVYSPTGWTNAGNSCCGWFNNTLSYNSTIGSTITFTQTFNKLVWYAERAANKGRVAVQVDNGPIVTITLTTAAGQAGSVDNVTKRPSYVWKGTQGVHTIKLTTLTADIAHDKFVYHFTR